MAEVGRLWNKVKAAAEDHKICPLTKNRKGQSVLQAYGEEVHMFMHCHLRGYDNKGTGKEMTGCYYDKYGAPVSHDESWTEGYRSIEQELARLFDESTNPYNELPLLAGYGGGVHMYKPIKYHTEEPWNVTGWVPLENKWLCEGKFFRNRYFFALRGSEIQNDLWDYHPYKNDWKVPIGEVDAEDILVDCIKHVFDQKRRQSLVELRERSGSAIHYWGEVDESFLQLSPIDKYRGGYWYNGDVRGRYLHIMCLKDHKLNDKGHFDRYNYIVHPLAFRAATASLPDNSVDGMQWCIANIHSESHFGEGPVEERLSKWGDHCNGLEIFNDFTLFYSWQPPRDDPQIKFFNSQLQNYGVRTRKCYHYTYNTYPMEFGEFLLDYALTMGTYLHPISASDAFFNRKIIPINELDEDAEGMERVLLSDPKGNLVQRVDEMIWQEGCKCKSAHMEKIDAKEVIKPDSEKATREHDQQDYMRFREEKPYGESTIFGYTSLIDTKRTLCNIMQENPPSDNVYEYTDEEEDWNTGLNIIESHIIRMLRHGEFYSHTGVFNIFNYVDKDEADGQIVPFIIKGQQDPQTFCYEIKGSMSLDFCFERVKCDELVWRYQIQEMVPGSSNVQTTYGYFKLSSSKKTHLNLSKHAVENVTWIRFSAFQPANPMRRAWFLPVKGPSFGKPTETMKEEKKTIEEFPHLQQKEVIMVTSRGEEDDVDIVTESHEFTPFSFKSENLDFVFKKCTQEEMDDFLAYFFRAYPLRQPIKENFGTYFSKTKEGSSEPFASRIMENVHGYFELCPFYASRLCLQLSWDPSSVVNGEVCVYAIDAHTAQPKDAEHLFLADGLPEECRKKEE